MTFRQLFVQVRKRSGDGVALFDAAWPQLARAISQIKYCPPNWLDQEVSWNTANLCYGAAIATFVRVAAGQTKSPDDIIHQTVASLAEIVRQMLNDACGVVIEPIAVMPLERMVRMANLANTLPGVDEDLLAKLDAADEDFMRNMRPAKRRKRNQ